MLYLGGKKGKNTNPISVLDNKKKLRGLKLNQPERKYESGVITNVKNMKDLTTKKKTKVPNKGKI